jgi:hypothetical protein
MPPKKAKSAPAGLPDNALAKQALDTIKQIEREAQDKKLVQLDMLKTARATITERINELQHQLAQIDKTMESITGQPVTREKRERRNLEEVRERVARWMEGRRGQKFSAGDLVKEFPELDGVAISIFIKPLVESGKVHNDSSDGVRRMKYFVPDNA